MNTTNFLRTFVLLCTFCLFVAKADVVCAQDNQGEPQPLYRFSPQQYVLPKDSGATAKVLLDENALAITAPGDQKTFAFNLGWMPVQPNTAYSAQYHLRPESLKKAANIYLLLREHEAEGTRPMTPYHVESVRRRELSIDAKRAWIDHQVTFTTAEKTQFLSGSLVIVQLDGTVHLSAFELWSDASLKAKTDAVKVQTEAQAQNDYAKTMATLHEEAASRKQLAPRTLVFSRAQMKYTLGKNYYHDWIDRPLLANRDYRVASRFMTPLPNYKRTLEEVRNYDIDGLAFFPETKDRMPMFDAHEEASISGVGLLPEFLATDDAAAVDAKAKIIQRALKSTFVPRLDGKILVTSYGAQSLSPERWKVLLAELRQRVGDTFIFLPSLTYASSLQKPYFLQNKPIPLAEIEKVKQALRAYLDVTDGIYFNYPPALYKFDHTFDAAYYREILIPLMKSVLSEPAYRQKYFGLSAYKSHVNPDRGNNLWQDGTRTLRGSFEAAMDAKPDVIILPEWDEQNENTSWRPTVYGARSNERIVRYYMSEIKNKKPSAIPGDDVDIPNLTLSTRKIAVIGENLMIELLNIPDGSQGTYTAQLILQDENGNTIKTYDPFLFDTAKLEEHRVYLPTETIPRVRALNPVLKITGYKGHDYTFDEGFHATQLRATWNWDFLYVNQPLRDMMRPVTASLMWEKPTQKSDPLILTGSISAPDDLNMVEVLGDDDEVYAVDPQKEFFRDDPDRALIYIDYRSQYNNGQEINGALTLKNATAEWLTQGNILHQDQASENIKDQKLQLKSPVSMHVRWIYLAVPKKDIEKGELDFNFDKAKFTVPLKVLLEKQLISYPFAGGIIFTIKNYHRQIDMPMPLKTKSASFRVNIKPEIATEQYHLRATSIAGKIYRTRPLLIPSDAASPYKKLRVYSEAQKRGVDVQVAADRIPDLTYDFDPSHGAALLTQAGVPFWGTLGGMTDSTTGRGTPPAIFTGKGKFNFPDDVGISAPKWVTENGESALEFDGKGTFLVLPRETLPFKGAFTLSFDVKPNSSGNQALIIDCAHPRQRGLQLTIQGGTLRATFQNGAPGAISMDTKLPVPANQWSHVEVRHDFDKLTVTVNGKTASVDSPSPANNIGFTVIGAGLNKPWFAGKFRNLCIVHNVFP